MDKQELKNYLVDEAEYSIEEVNEMSDFELVDNWLAWQGIVDWTEDIIDVIKAAYDVEF